MSVHDNLSTENVWSIAESSVVIIDTIRAELEIYRRAPHLLAFTEDKTIEQRETYTNKIVASQYEMLGACYLTLRKRGAL